MINWAEFDEEFQAIVMDLQKRYDGKGSFRNPGEEGECVQEERPAELLQTGVYRHFKGDLYRVYGVADHSETGEKHVVYRALYGEEKWYVRPYDMFISEVDKNKYPDVKQVMRFELITADA